ncbi:ribulose bisphosphate carboxylase small chain 1, chloroplastic [Vigna radiata var. radiata]|uniref:Ribulose bisphosphate carboxylase small subunit, chloroplastic n=1 Tax=Vigna radiata var. radiata TaxID=3916 RepID=Q9XQB5_VIGRR|nr:ribulose bisphosphate carboxylase small chain 1, chloroplastic [Vigna radiata var. radiata]XP_014516547.1 ribulose bisphosphate carboxylase small chain 1, chloroplastic [Vigna radiata var. radiata]AAD27881.1 ribulose-1,5-bisphosphate carboxylase small subunit [Vigna radiata]
MASSMISSPAVTTVNRAGAAGMVAPFTGLKSLGGFPTRKTNNDITSVANNGGRVQCMQVWPTIGKKKFETLSYLPDLTEEQLGKEVDYLLRSGWIPCLEFELSHKDAFPHRENNRSPGYYDGRYWTMWKLPMYGCTDSSQVLKELREARTLYPDGFVRIVGFDSVRQVQCISFIAYKPPGY